MSNRDRLRDEYESSQEGVVNELQELFDDANAKLEIGYSATLSSSYMEAGRMKRRLAAIDSEHQKAVDRVNALGAAAPKSVNERAHRAIARLIEQGFTAQEASALVESGEFEGMSEDPGVDDDYLGDTITNIMQPSLRPTGHGGGGGGKSRKQRPKPTSMVDRIIIDDEPKPSNDEERAQRFLRDNARAIENRNGPGRPLTGAEKKMRLNVFMEPTRVIEIHQLTGMDCAEALVALHELLKMAKSNIEIKQIEDFIATLVDGSKENDAA